MRFKQTRKLKRGNQRTQAENDKQTDDEYIHVEHLEEDGSEAENSFENDEQTDDDDIQFRNEHLGQDGSENEYSFGNSDILGD